MFKLTRLNILSDYHQAARAQWLHCILVIKVNRDQVHLQLKVPKGNRSQVEREPEIRH